MFKGKVAIITGAGSGIGKAVALELAKQGAKVALVNRTESKGEAVLKEITELGGEAIYIQADVTKEVDVTHYMEKTLEKWGTVDILFNNAGVSGTPKPLHLVDIDDFNSVVDTNIRGVFFGMKYMIKLLLKQEKEGVIVNTASQAGIKPIPYLTGYSASKHAVVAMTKTAAFEYANKGIRINALCPGLTTTEMTSIEGDHVPQEKIDMYERAVSKIPSHRSATSEEMAKHALFLMGDESSYMNGVPLLVDGGALLV